MGNRLDQEAPVALRTLEMVEVGIKMREMRWRADRRCSRGADDVRE